jgi:hypothetical protein
VNQAAHPTAPFKARHLDVKELPEAKRIFDALGKEIETLKHLRSLLGTRIERCERASAMRR